MSTETWVCSSCHRAVVITGADGDVKFLIEADRQRHADCHTAAAGGSTRANARARRAAARADARRIANARRRANQNRRAS